MSAILEKPRVGGWAVPIVLFGLVGGVVGWFALKGRDRRRADHVLKWGAIASFASAAVWVVLWLGLFAILASSTQSADASYSESTYGDTTTQSDYVGATTTTPTPSSTPLGALVDQQTEQLTSSDGYSATADVSVYAAAHADALPPLPASDRSTLASCVADRQTDAVIPIEYTLTNTTPSFSMELGVKLNPDESDGGDIGNRMSADAMFSDNTPSCTSLSDGSTALFSMTFNDPIAPGASASGDLFVIVPGYFTPADPAGDPSTLSAVKLAIGITTTTTSTARLEPDPAEVSLVGPSAGSVKRPAAPAGDYPRKSGVELNDAGYALMRAGRYSAALPLIAAAVAKLEGSGELDEAYAKFNLAYTRFHLGDCTDVLTLLDSAEAIEGSKTPIDNLRAKARSVC